MIVYTFPAKEFRSESGLDVIEVKDHKLTLDGPPSQAQAALIEAHGGQLESPRTKRARPQPPRKTNKKTGD